MTELVFIHGWGFDTPFWDPLAALLSDYPQRRIDLGFFGNEHGVVPLPLREGLGEGQRRLPPDAILIGHSLGFVHGSQQRQDWTGWVAINSFARFIDIPNKIGCVPADVLRDMRKRFTADPARTLNDFYAFIGAQPPETVSPDAERLLTGLDELRDTDISEILSARDVPGLVLATRNDVLVPAKATEALAKQGKRVKLQWFGSGNHMLPQRDPIGCAAAIKHFLIDISKI